MPELPDVETFRRYIDATSLHKIIKDVRVENKKILEDISYDMVKQDLMNSQFIETYRHGKYLFLKTSSQSWVIVHFGMTGFVRYFKEIEDKPSHTRLLINFENGFYLAFDNQRLLGKINIVQDKDEYLKNQNLGIDALRVNYTSFRKLLKNRRGMAKSTLMNQSILSGIGNIYADEILFQSGIYPKTKMNQLNENDFKSMYQNMKEIFKVAIKKQVNTDEFPDYYLFPQRKKGGICPKGGNKLKTTKVNSRTTYYCPIHQKKK